MKKSGKVVKNSRKPEVKAGDDVAESQNSRSYKAMNHFHAAMALRQRLPGRLAEDCF